MLGRGLHERLTALSERLSWTQAIPDPPRKILIVDDEEGIRKFIDRVLQRAGYDTVSAPDGPTALAVAARVPSIDMIVTDVMMPEMSGCELARGMRRKNPDIKVLYVTGYSDRLFDETVLMWENEAFIDKPCSAKALLEAISLLWSHQLGSDPAPAFV